MTLVFPRDMVGGLRWREPRLMLQYRQELSRNAAGQTQGKDLGSPIWRAQFRSVPIRLSDARAAMANFRSLGGVLRPFYVYDPTAEWPSSLPDGSSLAGATVQVRTIRGDNAALSLKGLPVGLQMRPGDMLSIRTAAGGRELVQVVTGSTANALGNTGDINVVPHLRAAVAVNDLVDLVRPMAEMRLEPNSLDDPFEGPVHRAITFSATQVIR